MTQDILYPTDIKAKLIVALRSTRPDHDPKSPKYIQWIWDVNSIAATFTDADDQRNFREEVVRMD